MGHDGPNSGVVWLSCSFGQFLLCFAVAGRTTCFPHCSREDRIKHPVNYVTNF